MAAVDPEALAAWLAALDIASWAPPTAAERDVVRRCLAPAPQTPAAPAADAA